MNSSTQLQMTVTVILTSQFKHLEITLCFFVISPDHLTLAQIPYF